MGRVFLAQRTFQSRQLLTSCLSIQYTSLFAPLTPSRPSLWELCHTCNYYSSGHLVPPPFLSALGGGAVVGCVCLAPAPCMLTVTHWVHHRHCLRGCNAVPPLPGPWGYPLAAVKWSSGGLSFRTHLSGKSCVSGGLSGLDDSQARANHPAQPASDVAGLVGAHKQREMVGIGFRRVSLL